MNKSKQKRKGETNSMELFNIICGVCSVVGLLVSIFTASKVIKILNNFNYGNKEDHSRVINKGKDYSGSYVGRDSINGKEEHR